jgi:hypothetical protein
MLFTTFALWACIQEKIAVARNLLIKYIISGGKKTRENITGQGLSLASM